MLGLRHTAIDKSDDSLITAFFSVIPNIRITEIELPFGPWLILGFRTLLCPLPDVPTPYQT